MLVGLSYCQGQGEGSQPHPENTAQGRGWPGRCHQGEGGGGGGSWESHTPFPPQGQAPSGLSPRGSMNRMHLRDRVHNCVDGAFVTETM